MSYVVLRWIPLPDDPHPFRGKYEVLVKLDPPEWSRYIDAALCFEDVKEAQSVAIALAPEVGTIGYPTSVEDREYAAALLTTGGFN